MREDFRAGFVSVVGRPNTGKSTLINALVGQKVVITSARPETTRRVIRAIVTREAGQLILVDTPGMHRPRTLLGERLDDMVRDAIADVDTELMCLPANEPVGPGDRYLLDLAKKGRVPIVAAVTKTDLVSPVDLGAKLAEVSALYDFADIVPVSARAGVQTEELVNVLIGRMPASPPLYPPDATSDQSEETIISELIREAGLERLRDELPHSLAVTIDEIQDGRTKNGAPLTRIHASLHVERDSQKGIVIGKGGRQLRQIGKEARASIERMLGTRVYLSLHVKVSKDWQRDPKMLGRFGF
ncbi:GTPase Era [Neoactinobaculum massilliense]|uniref:GTPase Era n=1 Tax=Neoactinobaculum massilliense TaxID=2364794 RepID=UPI000F5240D0|nr:GTPase Era [Neoactinobaculum massilliense]